MTIPFNTPTNLEKPQLSNEQLELKARCTELFSEISQLKQRLSKAQQEYYDCRQRFEQLDRQQALKRVKRVSYSGPRKKSVSEETNAIALIARMTPQQQAELLAALS